MSGGDGRQAVVLVHGMSDQIPLDTSRAFVEAVWTSDGDVHRQEPHAGDIWIRPDDRTGSLELSKITSRASRPTPSHPHGVRSDFYELYWADLTANTTWDGFVTWFWYLLLRSPGRVPPNVFPIWVVMWIVTVPAVLLALVPVIPVDLLGKHVPPWILDVRLLVILVIGALVMAVHQFTTKSFGRVARYTRAEPENIAARAAIRQRGLDLLTALHEVAPDGSSYDRIILVGHSLGSMLAYDLLGFLWSRRLQARTFAQGTPDFAALRAFEAAARDLDERMRRERAPWTKLSRQEKRAAEAKFNPASWPEVAAFGAAQRALRQALASRSATKAAEAERRWLISDFVTLGSPLTHAEFLIAASRTDLEAKQNTREFTETPPFRDTLDGRGAAAAVTAGLLLQQGDPKLVSFPEFRQPDTWVLHHAAPFAAVRWTNIYDPAHVIVFGDLIGGPLAHLFGPAITDVDLAVLRGGPSFRFTHTDYWTVNADPTHIQALRRAVNLLDG